MLKVNKLFTLHIINIFKENILRVKYYIIHLLLISVILSNILMIYFIYWFIFYSSKSTLVLFQLCLNCLKMFAMCEMYLDILPFVIYLTKQYILILFALIVDIKPSIIFIFKNNTCIIIKPFIMCYKYKKTTQNSISYWYHCFSNT